jgi:hypothetical protein
MVAWSAGTTQKQMVSPPLLASVITMSYHCAQQ